MQRLVAQGNEIAHLQQQVAHLTRELEARRRPPRVEDAVRAVCGENGGGEDAIALLLRCSGAIASPAVDGHGGEADELARAKAELGLLQRATDAQAEVVGQLRKRKRAQTTLQRSVRHDAARALVKLDDHAQAATTRKAHLPEALRHFMKLTDEDEVKAASDGLHELEMAVARAPDDTAAVGRLRERHTALAAAFGVVIARRTADATLTELVPLCAAAIDAGNRDFLLVYDGVWKVIQGGEAASVNAYRDAADALRLRCKGEAVQSEEAAADPATLFAGAARIKPLFDEIVEEVSKKTAATLELAVLSDHDTHGREVTGLKKTVRIVEKAALRPGGGRGQCERVCDVVRAMLIAKDMATVVLIAQAFVALSEAGVVEIVRIKDRFTTSSAGGWRDLMINFVITGDNGERHVCEVQVVHEMMLTARKGLPGHEIYAIVRIAMELIESCCQEHALQVEKVRALREGGATRVEVLCACEDAWILDEPAWIEAFGSREKLVQTATKYELNSEGRIGTLDLEGNEQVTVLPASVCKLRGLTSVVLQRCRKLQSVMLGTSGLTSIGASTFSGCSSLSAIELPSSLTSIGGSAFNGCSSLSAIELPSSLTSIGDGAFEGCSSLSAIELPSSLTSIGVRAFDGCSSLSAIELPSSLTSIGVYAFSGCSSLSAIELPSSLTSIGGGAFEGCSSLSAIELPSSLTSIGGYAFNGCSSLSAIELPSSLTSIGGSAFFGCSSLSAIELPSSLTSIGVYAFYGCSSLSAIELPSSLTSIGDGAFDGCSSLSERATAAIAALKR